MIPTLDELTAWYRTLVASRTFRSSCHGRAYFYEAWSDDADLERDYEAWVDDVGNPLNLPLDLFEEELVRAERFAELHGFWSRLDDAQLARALPMAKAFVAAPKRRPRR